MKIISLWAKNNVWNARILICIIYILLNVIGICTGELLREINIQLPETVLPLCLIFTAILAFGYPAKNNGSKGTCILSNYAHRKIFDFLLGLITFILICYTGNNREHLFAKVESVSASIVYPDYHDTTLLRHPLITNFIQNLKTPETKQLSQRSKFKLIKKQVKTIRHATSLSDNDKTILIILSVLIALGLLFLLAGASCSLSCSGSEALAVIVLVGGSFLIIFFLIRIIKQIRHPRKKAEETNESK